MPVDRLKTDRYSSDKSRAQSSARANIQIVISNINRLKRDKDIRAAKSFYSQKEPYTPNQMSYIESLYEKVFAGANYSSCSTKHDFSRRRI